MPSSLHGIVDRRLGAIALERLRDEPVVLLQGPRSVGKSTLMRDLAKRLGAEIIDLDDLATRDAVSADPATFVAGPDIVCIDEYQHVPLVLDAIKAELNRDGRPGRYLLTGSARHESLPAVAQALTGRLHRLPVHPLSQGEIAGIEEHFLERVFAGEVGSFGIGSSVGSRDDSIERVVAGGFPMPLARAPGASRARWIDDYVRLTLERDVRELAHIEEAAALPRLLGRLAGQTGQILNVTKAASELGIAQRTADSYVRLLEAVFLVYRLPAWGTTLTVRAGSRPKVHMVDSGVAARLLRLTPEKLGRRDAAALTELGHLLETFVVGELLKQASWMDGIAGVGHWRTRDDDEVDLVIERDDGAIVAFEVKAAQRVGGKELGPLRKLREAAGAAFLAGIALHLGDRAYQADDRLHVVPVAQLWMS